MHATDSGIVRYWIFIVAILCPLLLISCGHSYFTGLRSTDLKPTMHAFPDEKEVPVVVSGKLTKDDELFKDSHIDRYELDLSGIDAADEVMVLLGSEDFIPYLSILNAETGKVLAESKGQKAEKAPARVYWGGPVPIPSGSAAKYQVLAGGLQKGTGYYHLTLCAGWVDNINDSGPGSLRYAVANARPIGAICFDPDVFHAGAPWPDKTITVLSEIVIDKNLAVAGPGTNAIAVSGGGSSRVFMITEDAEVYIRGLAIIDGNGGSEAGGGICNYGSLTMVDSVVSGSTAADGGGLCNYNELVLRYTDVSNNEAVNRGGGIFNEGGAVWLRLAGDMIANSANDGGGIYNHEGQVQIRHSRIEGNQAKNGGGLYNRYGTLFLQGDTWVLNNSASQRGGGIYIEDVGIHGQTLIYDNSSLHSNTSELGGGVYNDGGVLVVEYNGRINPWHDPGVEAVYSNNATTGGGIYNNDFGRVTVRTSNIFKNNSARQDGGGVYNRGEFRLEQGSSITDNGADNNGGGIYNQNNGHAEIIGASSVTNNNAGNHGGGIFNNNGQISGATQNIQNNHPDDIHP